MFTEARIGALVGHAFAAGFRTHGANDLGHVDDLAQMVKVGRGFRSVGNAGNIAGEFIGHAWGGGRCGDGVCKRIKAAWAWGHVWGPGQGFGLGGGGCRSAVHFGTDGAIGLPTEASSGEDGSQ